MFEQNITVMNTCTTRIHVELCFTIFPAYFHLITNSNRQRMCMLINNQLRKIWIICRTAISVTQVDINNTTVSSDHHPCAPLVGHFLHDGVQSCIRTVMTFCVRTVYSSFKNNTIRLLQVFYFSRK